VNCFTSLTICPIFSGKFSGGRAAKEEKELLRQTEEARRRPYGRIGLKVCFSLVARPKQAFSIVLLLSFKGIVTAPKRGAKAVETLRCPRFLESQARKSFPFRSPANFVRQFREMTLKCA
jgi:hypothetical protein